MKTMFELEKLGQTFGFHNNGLLFFDVFPDGSIHIWCFNGAMPTSELLLHFVLTKDDMGSVNRFIRKKFPPAR